MFLLKVYRISLLNRPLKTSLFNSKIKNMLKIVDYIDVELSKDLNVFFDSLESRPIWQSPDWNEKIICHIPKRYFILYSNNEIVSYCVVMERKILARVLFGPLFKSYDSGLELLFEIFKFHSV